jgi:galactokinase
MPKHPVYEQALARFRSVFDCDPTGAAYAPGRVEVLGNHTDYNAGYVLSAAIDLGTFFLVAPAGNDECRLVAGDIMEQVRFSVADPAPDKATVWANYVKGVFAALRNRAGRVKGFNGLFLGNIPLGSGLSSSAALELSAGLALAAHYGLDVPKIEMARIGQAAEHDYVGVHCGLLDQVTSLFGRRGSLVMTDFRSLQVLTEPLGSDACFVLCNTNAKHALVDGVYNERRAHCEAAAEHFAAVLSHPVTALRDVSWAEWEAHRAGMDQLTAKRAAHPIGENERVLAGRAQLQAGDLAGFGAAMFASHASSRTYFENSCEELDFVVDLCRRIPGVLGARLSGGGFGGSVVILVHPRDAEMTGQAIRGPYARRFGHPCGIRVVVPSDGAATLENP